MDAHLVKNNDAMQPVDLVADFWQKSCDFYNQQEVKTLLLALQDQYGYAVNRLLFCLWFSQLFQQLIDAGLTNSNVESILACEESIAKMRAARKELEEKHSKPKLEGHLNKVRYHLLEAELSMEKEIQVRLVNHFCEGKYQPVNQISAETLDFLISENISLLCSHRTSTEESQLQKLSMLWIQHQDCYN